MDIEEWASQNMLSVFKQLKVVLVVMVSLRVMQQVCITRIYFFLAEMLLSRSICLCAIKESTNGFYQRHKLLMMRNQR
jgi:hypothetical protein